MAASYRTATLFLCSSQQQQQPAVGLRCDVPLFQSLHQRSGSRGCGIRQAAVPGAPQADQAAAKVSSDCSLCLCVKHSWTRELPSPVTWAATAELQCYLLNYSLAHTTSCLLTNPVFHHTTTIGQQEQAAVLPQLHAPVLCQLEHRVRPRSDPAAAHQGTTGRRLGAAKGVCGLGGRVRGGCVRGGC